MQLVLTPTDTDFLAIDTVFTHIQTKKICNIKSLLLTFVLSHNKYFLSLLQIKKLSFPLERCPRLCLRPSNWVCMEVFNINNDRGVFSIPWLKPRALKTLWSLLIHYITPENKDSDNPVFYLICPNYNQKVLKISILVLLRIQDVSMTLKHLYLNNFDFFQQFQ